MGVRTALLSPQLHTAVYTDHTHEHPLRSGSVYTMLTYCIHKAAKKHMQAVTSSLWSKAVTTVFSFSSICLPYIVSGAGIPHVVCRDVVPFNHKKKTTTIKTLFKDSRTVISPQDEAKLGTPVPDQSITVQIWLVENHKKTTYKFDTLVT